MEQESQPENPSQSHSRLVVEFTEDHGCIIKFDGTVSAYMMLGAAGVIQASAQQMMADASARNRERALDVVRSLPGGLPRQ